MLNCRVNILQQPCWPLLPGFPVHLPVTAEKLVDLGGLKQLFGLFMGKAKVKGPAGKGEALHRRGTALCSNHWWDLGQMVTSALCQL